MLGTSNDNFITINNIELGEGAELINCFDRYWKSGQARAETFVGDCILAETVIQPNLRFSNFTVEGNFIDLMIAIVHIVS